MSIVVLCPTRRRPGKAAEMVASFRATASLFDTDLVLVVDDDDPTLPGYRALMPALTSPQPLQPSSAVGLVTVRGGNLTAATNEAVVRVWDDATIVGHVGDDHRFRTPGWDRLIADRLARPGIASGDDGHRGPDMPTAWFASTAIVRALGWLALPGTFHLTIDRAWLTLGRAAGCFHYLPEVSIEHLHPTAGKADWDDGYRAANAPSMYRHDRAVYREWVIDGLEADVARVRGVMAVAA